METADHRTAPLRLTFDDATLEDLRAPAPYDVLLGCIATVRLEFGGVVVYREDLFPIAELALALEDWLHGDFACEVSFSFDSVEHDEPGFLWCRRKSTGWRFGSTDEETADPVTHSGTEVAEALSDFVRTVRSWLRACTGRELETHRPPTRPVTQDVGA